MRNTILAANEEFVVRDIEVQLGCTVWQSNGRGIYLLGVSTCVYRIFGKWLNHVESTSRGQADKKGMFRAIVGPPQQLMQLMHFMDPEVVFRRSPVKR